jgi:hypothetical protein
MFFVVFFRWVVWFRGGGVKRLGGVGNRKVRKG